MLCNTELNKGTQILKCQKMSGHDHTLQLVDTKPAFVTAVYPYIPVKDAVASHVCGKKIRSLCFQSAQIFQIRIKFMNQGKWNHIAAGAGFPFPYGHTLYIPGTGEYVEIGIVTEDRVVKNGQTGLQHNVQGIGTAEGELQLPVPVVIFVKDLLGKAEDVREIAFLPYNQYSGGFGKVFRISLSCNDKAAVLVIFNVLCYLRSSDKIDISPGYWTVFLIKTDTVQHGGICRTVKVRI